MTDIQLAHLSFGGEGRDRNHEHLIALREARIATDHRAGTMGTTARSTTSQSQGFVTRLRLAFAGGPPIASDACNCPA